jgi:hypothetical protein
MHSAIARGHVLVREHDLQLADRRTGPVVERVTNIRELEAARLLARMTKCEWA